MRLIGDLTVIGELIDFKPENLATDPVSPAVSQMWYNTTTNTLKYYDGTAVRTLSQGGDFGDYIQRDGSVAMTGALVLSSDDQSAEADNVAASKGYVDTEVATKQDTITGAASTITSSNLTADRAVISDATGKVVVSTVTAAEIGYLSGVTSGIQLDRS